MKRMTTREVLKEDSSGRATEIVYRRSPAERAAARASREQAKERAKAVSESVRRRNPAT